MINRFSNEKVLVGYLGDVTLNKIRPLNSKPINRELYHPIWYYENSKELGKFIEFIPDGE